MKLNKIYNEDCIEGMKKLKENSIDAIVTDQPYGFGFMGKKWDKFGENEKKDGKNKQQNFQQFSLEWATEAYRVLKPGGHLLSFGGTRTYHRMACGIEDAGFEIRDQIQWIYGCVSEDTEVLTNNGWKKYCDVNNDKILQWNKDTNELTWIKPTEKFEYDIHDEMILFENRNTSQLITKNHSVLAKIKKHSRNKKATLFERIDAIDIRKHWIIDLPLAGKLKNGLNEPNAYMIGWWLTDAWKHSGGKACMFSQCKKVTLKKLRIALNESDCKFSEYTKTPKKSTHKTEHTFYVTGNIAKFLLKNYPNRRMNYSFLNWNYGSRLSLIDGLLDGDGSRRRNQNNYSEVFWSKNEERLDIFQSLCVSLNIRSHIDYNKGCVYLNMKRNTTQLQYEHKKPLQKYNGKVWCFRTETGAFVARRNGKAFITGNSGFPKSLNVGKAIDKMEENKREVIGTLADIHPRYGIPRKDGDIYNMGFGKSEEAPPLTKGDTQWEGYGTALKPANEPICMARKPLSEKTVALNVLKWGTGAINIDGCRIKTGDDIRPTIRGGPIAQQTTDNSITGWNKKDYNGIYNPSHKGRFPANVILDGEAGRLLDKQSGIGGGNSTISYHKGKTNDLIYGKYGATCGVEYKGKGGASRFFKTIKPSDPDEEAPPLTKGNMQWERCGTALKPANEPICMARKPLSEKTVALNVLKWGTGAINIDGCRINYERGGNIASNPLLRKQSGAKINHGKDINPSSYVLKKEVGEMNINCGGRFPANVILDEEAGRLLDIQAPKTGQMAATTGNEPSVTKLNQIYGDYRGYANASEPRDKLGGASRFFYCAKADRSERDVGCDKLEEKKGVRINEDIKTKPRLNVHPTVKPIKLMSYLIKLVTPPNGIVLDPFTGSGTTQIAAYLEHFKFIGFEKDPEYFKIAQARIKHYVAQKRLKCF